MRVLGVDPGLTRCGLGVVESGTGRGAHCVAVDVVRTSSDCDVANRLLRIATRVEEWLDYYRPEAVAVERVFSQQNVRTVMGTAQAGGVVASSAARRELPVVFHTPSEVKAAVSGSGRADKAQVTAMVTKLLGLSSEPKPADAADALALAVCHLWRQPMRGRLAEAEAQAATLARNHRSRLAAAKQQATGQRSATARRSGNSGRNTR